MKASSLFSVMFAGVVVLMTVWFLGTKDPETSKVAISAVETPSQEAAPHIVVPGLLTAYDELIKKAPVGTRGFFLAVTATLPGNVAVALPDQNRHGGCDGLVGPGGHTEFSSTQQTLSVPVDDVDTLVTFTVAATWVVADDGVGCPVGTELKVQE